MNKKHLSIIIGLSTLFFVTCKKDSGNDDTTTTTTTTTSAPLTEKEQAAKDYKDMYLGSAYTGFTWNGNTSTCSPGTLPQDMYDKAMLRIKYFRKVAGLPTTGLSMEADLSAKCQQHALMTKVNGALSHTPDTTWKCYTADGALAAANSNIAIGASDISNIDMWMEDPGTGNERVGHRRWILYSNASKFGFGTTESSASLWVINGGGNFALPAGTPEFIAWPAKGYVPRQLVFPRWSFGIPWGSFPFQVDFTNAVVTMKDPAGANVSLTVINRTAISSSYRGDNTISWEPVGVQVGSNFDQKYTVTITGVMVNGVSKDYTYDVTIFNP